MRYFFVATLLIVSTMVMAALPESVRLDQYLLELSKIYESERWQEALQTVKKIEVLSVDKPPAYYYITGVIYYHNRYFKKSLDYLEKYLSQEEKGKYYNSALDFYTKAEGEVQVIEINTNMVRIPEGCFQMGSLDEEADSDKRPHRVCVKAFEIGKYEVTQGEWQAVMGHNPARFANGDRYPVEQVSWNDAQGYVRRLNQRTGQSYRLPTEAEWEYACRGGVAAERYCGGNMVDRVAWYQGNSDRRTHSVGEKAANGFGLYDLSGNVWEWTCSRYDRNYGGAEKYCNDKDTSGPLAVRGGSWYITPAGVRSANRGRDAPTVRNDNLGFRLARSL